MRSGGAASVRWLVPLGIALLLALPALLWLPSPGPSDPLDGLVAGPSHAVVVAPAYVPPAGARVLGALPPSYPVEVLVGLAPRDPAGLEARAILAETPGSPLYRSYLSPAELAESYGPSPAALHAARSYFGSRGLTVATSRDGLLLELSGPSTAVASAFSTSFVRYQVGDRTLFAHPSPASLPSGIPWAGALGLGNTTPLEPLLAPAGAAVLPDAPGGASTCPVTGEPYEPCQIAAAYNATPLESSGINGTGYRIAVVDAYDSAEPQPQLASDLASFDNHFDLPTPTTRFVYPDPTTQDLNDSASSGWGDEEALDIEWSHASAPGATVEMVFSPDASVGLYYAVDWLVANQAADVISLSWGEPDTGVYNAFSTPCSDQCNATTDGSYTLLHPVLEEAAAEGIGVFAASGDCGAADGTSGVAPNFPASDPFVTGVGGTVLDYNASQGGYVAEAGWSGNSSGARSPGCVNQGGSGGGYSPLPRPPWQSAPGVPSSVPGRGVPDVSAVGGSPVYDFLDGSLSAAAGTSLSTPVWAGFEILADQKQGGDLGSLNPSLYALARGSLYHRYFHDVTTGNNGYAAGVGWDPVTGLGSPNESALAAALGRPSVATDGLAVDLYGEPRYGPAPLTTSFAVDVTGGTGNDAFVDVYFGDGNASWLPTGTVVNHTYAEAGVYEATATVVDSSGNSSTSPPLTVVVGGGTELDVALNVSTTTPSVSSPVTLTASVTNASGPFRYDFYFGDGTYRFNQTNATASHVYASAGSYCAAVVARDLDDPPDGGASARVAIAAGGAPAPACPTPAALKATFNASVLAADLPGDLPFEVNTTGGTPPVSVQYVSDDPYVRACDCGIFRTAGNHTVRAYVNDSLDEGTTAELNVTLYPALSANISNSSTLGPAPLTVAWDVVPSGGHFTGPPHLVWSFGDGSSLVTSNDSVQHTYVDPGIYTARVDLSDQGGGNVSMAWLVDVTNGTPGFATTFEVSPAENGSTGAPYEFAATSLGGTTPYTYRWSLGQNDSAFGAVVNQSYSPTGCLADGLCPLRIGLQVTDALGTAQNLTMLLPDPFHGSASGLFFNDSGLPGNGTTPLLVQATATATGMPKIAVAWAFGDGNRSSGLEENHTYYEAGNYTLVETATDPYGDRLVRTHALEVTGPSYPPLLTSLTVTNSTGVQPLAVTFNTTAAGGTGGPYHIDWRFGDGNTTETAAGTPVNHTYVDPGTFEAVATLVDSHGDTAEAAANVTVYALTVVLVAVTLTPDPLAVGSLLDYSVSVDALCVRFSVPGCGNASVPISLGVTRPNGTAAEVDQLTGPTNASAAGWLNGSLGLPGVGGPVWIWALTAGPYYAGHGNAPELVVGAPANCGAACSLAPGTIGFGLVLLAATGGAVGVAAALLWNRSRRLPPPPGPPTASP